jgi:hypothetical protein
MYGEFAWFDRKIKLKADNYSLFYSLIFNRFADDSDIGVNTYESTQNIFVNYDLHKIYMIYYL